MAPSPPPSLAPLALVALLALAVATPARGWDREAPSAALSVSNGGNWGYWGDPEFCPGDSFAHGFQLKVEPPKGFFGDDVGLTGVRLLCEGGGQATSSEGLFGTWGRPETCPSGQRLVAFRLRVEEPQGLWDDTAANAVAAVCSGGSVLEGRGGPQGSWGQWSPSCPAGAAVCGLRTRLEPPQRGGAGDDTGLNDLDLYCCS